MENGVTQNNLIKNNVKIVIPLKHLSNFWRNLNIPLINCEVELILTWFKNCVLIDKLTRMLIIMLTHVFLRLIIQKMQHFK